MSNNPEENTDLTASSLPMEEPASSPELVGEENNQSPSFSLVPSSSGDDHSTAPSIDLDPEADGMSSGTPDDTMQTPSGLSTQEPEVPEETLKSLSLLPSDGMSPKIPKIASIPANPSSRSNEAPIAPLSSASSQAPSPSEENLNESDLLKQLHATQVAIAGLPSMVGDHRLLCPAIGEPMQTLEVDDEILNVSSAGAWFDGGELQAILSRNPNFVIALSQEFESQDAVETTSGTISEADALNLKKRQIRQLWNNLRDPRANSVQIEKRISSLEQSIHGTEAPEQSIQPSIAPDPSPAVTDSSAAGDDADLLCPASGKAMMKKVVAEIDLNLSAAGIWFDENGLKEVLQQRASG